ncbi:ATP-binding protein [Schinkia azotoformans]|uniref:ATP-binding protein n=1 Tax=Schinkia azotoformans TaxID=1454 RepID=UPI002DB783E5|nr:ATP-binding protein [Schinkia azotoformans]MEC1744146.1 ATP-binding protein [Schinkia azotoformans]
MTSEQCPYEECDGSGLIWVIDHQEKKEFMRPCKCKEEKALERMMRSAKVPEEFRNAKIASFRLNLYKTEKSQHRASTAKRVSVNYVKNFKEMQAQSKGLYFYSYTKGSGKTRLAASVGGALIQQHQAQVLFTTAVDCLAEIRKTFGENSKKNTSELIDALKNVEVLIVDDLGVENVSDWVEETFTTILEYRLTNKKVCIFTSNLSIEELNNKYKQGRVSSRIEKMAFPVYMPDESIRSDLAKKENVELQAILYE